MNLTDLFENRDSFAFQLIRQKARQLVRHPGFTKSDRPDIEQELVIELVQKYDQFDPKRARETTFIARVIEHKAVSLVRVRQAEKRHFRRNGKSLNETISDASTAHDYLGRQSGSRSCQGGAGVLANASSDRYRKVAFLCPRPQSRRGGVWGHTKYARLCSFAPSECWLRTCISEVRIWRLAQQLVR